MIGFAKDEWDDDDFRVHARSAVEAHSRTPLDEAAFKPFADSLWFISGTFDDEEALSRLKAALDHNDDELGAHENRLYYLAVPPGAFPTIVHSLAAIGANTPDSRIVVEKPFGHSLESARELSGEIHTAFDESQVFRIDHYLGKETVQNLVVFRFANAIWERVWNRDAVDHVQITVAESIGIEGRAGYYEQAGAIRDLLQNHILQVLAFLAMEPPRALEDESFRDEKVKLLQAMRRSTRPTSCAVSTAAIETSPASIRRARSRRSSRRSSTSTTGAGMACPSTCGTARSSPSATPRSPCTCARRPTCSSASSRSTTSRRTI